MTALTTNWEHRCSPWRPIGHELRRWPRTISGRAGVEPSADLLSPPFRRLGPVTTVTSRRVATRDSPIRRTNPRPRRFQLRSRFAAPPGRATTVDPRHRPRSPDVTWRRGRSIEAAPRIRARVAVRRTTDPEPVLVPRRGVEPHAITPVATLPTPDNANHLRAELDHLDNPGWCLGGDESAAAWGAPVFSAASRPWIWVPQEGDARSREARSCHARVATGR